MAIVVSNRSVSVERPSAIRPAQRRAVSGLKMLCVCLCCGPLMAACAALSRRPAPPPQYSDAHPPGFPPTIQWVGEMTERESRNWTASQLAGIAHSAQAKPLDILVLSGGGGAGAFGAGVLAGWSRLGTRPRFQIVTGVSVGALIAPFAFLGPHWNPELSLAFDGANVPPLLERRLFGWLGALFGWSVFRGEPLRALVDGYVTPDLLRAVAARAKSGRLLLVATTDLDSGNVLVWNMGAIASKGGRTSLRLFRQVLIASASIPGVFPPVLIPVQADHKIFDEMNVDGSASSAFLFAPGIASILPQQITPLRGANVYLVINGHLRPHPISTRNHTTVILMRSVATELASDSQVRVELAYSFASRQGVRLRVTAIAQSYRLNGLMGNLNPARMKALFAYGMRCARENRIWTDPIKLLNGVARSGSVSLDEAAPCPVAAVAAEAACAAGSTSDLRPAPLGPRTADGRSFTLVSTPGRLRNAPLRSIGRSAARINGHAPTVRSAPRPPVAARHRAGRGARAGAGRNSE